VEIAKVIQSKTVGFIILATVAVSMFMSWHSTAQLSDYVECQARWSQAYAQSAAQRAEAAADDRAALDRLVAAVAEATDRNQTRTALALYRQARATADQQRAENPPPEPPAICH
jgi:hypothetical protein